MAKTRKFVVKRTCTCAKCGVKLTKKTKAFRASAETVCDDCRQSAI